MDYPNLAGVATADLVDKIGTGKFTASYINWARTMHLLHVNAPGWLPELVNAPDGYIVHKGPVGAYLLIRFRNGEATTPAVPQAIMDSRNAAIPIDNITARDITDTHRRGVCMAAAFTFGLGYELWAKLPLESGYPEEPSDEPAKPAKFAHQKGNERAASAAHRVASEIIEAVRADMPLRVVEKYQAACDDSEAFADQVWDRLAPAEREYITAALNAAQVAA
jgi:hypothetical protein